MENPSYYIYIITGKSHWKKEFAEEIKNKYKRSYKIVNSNLKDSLKGIKFKPINSKKHVLLYEPISNIPKNDFYELSNYIKNPSKFGILIVSVKEWQDKKKILNNFRFIHKSKNTKMFDLDFPSQHFVEKYIRDLCNRYGLEFDCPDTFKFLVRRISSNTENIKDNIETLSIFTKKVTKDFVKEYTDDNYSFSYNKLFESLSTLNRKKIPFIAYNDLIEGGRKPLTIIINIRKHFILLYQAKLLKIKGILRNNDLIEIKKPLFDDLGIEFGDINIWKESNFKINSLLRESDNISLKEIVYVLNEIDKNINYDLSNKKELKYVSDESCYKTLLKILSRIEGE